MDLALVAVSLVLGVASYVLLVQYGVWRWLALLCSFSGAVLGLLVPPAPAHGGWAWLPAAPWVAVAVLGLAGIGRAEASELRVVILGAMVGTSLLVAAGIILDLTALSQSALLVGGPASGALGLTSLLSGRRSPASSHPQSDAVDEEALRVFIDEHGELALGPVVVVIAAYDEERGIGAVIDSLPEQVHGLHTDVVVVDDASSDTTADVVAASGRALVVRCPRNRGQGAALRLGYRIAREHGAHYIVTTDADGQYDPGDIPAVLAPILEDRADFVTGSRLLGDQASRDRVRRLGVHVFAWIVSAMAGQRITDTSFGLRAMRAAVTRRVTLNQPQYQSSELMLGVLSHGYRLLEVPGTMHNRCAGSSKKGRNLVYGSRYARVVVGTWWREGCLRPVTERAPALRGRGEHGARPS